MKDTGTLYTMSDPDMRFDDQSIAEKKRSPSPIGVWIDVKGFSLAESNQEDPQYSVSEKMSGFTILQSVQTLGDWDFLA